MVTPAHSLRAGYLLDQPGGYATFEPASLPPTDLALDGATHRCLSEADRELGFLHGQVAARPGSGATMDLACLREAVASCRLEGSQVTLPDMLWWDFDGANAAKSLSSPRGDLRVCANYAAILRRLSEPDGSEATPMLGKSLHHLHGQLYRGVRGRDARSGQTRRSAIWLGPQGSTLKTAHYVPPAPEHIPEHLARLLAFAVNDVDMPPLARIALITWQLESIHPFVDGSGWVTRLTLVRLLSETHGIASRLLCPSIPLAEDVGGYFRRLQSVRRDGDWEGWVLHFGTLLRDAARAGSVRLAHHDAVLREHEELIQREQPTVRETAIRLLHCLVAHPITSVQRVAEVCERTFANANLLVGRLEALGILQEITGRRRHRRYIYAPHAELLTRA